MGGLTRRVVEHGEATQRAIEAAGGGCLAFTADVTDEASIRGLRNRTLAAHGRCGIVVNDAGIFGPAPFEQVDFALWRRVLATNLDGQFLVATVFATDMVEQGWGRIVNVASSSIYTATPGATPYIASKAGILGLTIGLSNDLAPHGITVNAVSPPLARTPMVKSGIADGAFPSERRRAHRDGAVDQASRAA